jgi:NADP-dependent 3-hydroxy acid dehydrogenase YdfG
MKIAREFWHDKSVIITGASSGIGRAMAELLAPHGVKLGLIARRGPLLAELADAIRPAAAAVATSAADVTDPSAVVQAVEAVERFLGPCDVLIANAGIYRKTEVSQFDPGPIGDVMRTNYLGVVHALAAVLPGMIERRSGHVAAVGSIAAQLGLPAAGAYCASKAAVRVLLESLRVDLHSYNIRVTAVCPGHVDTAMITNEERETVKGLLSAAQAAERTCVAIQRGLAEDWFPRRTARLARLASWLPPGLYRRVMTHVPDMEET